MSLNIIRIDFSNPRQSKDLVELLDTYACDIMGGGKPLPESIKNNLPKELSKLPNVFSLLAYEEETAVGFANCIESFSTFACKKIVNIHDIAVHPQHRGKGVGKALLAKIDQIAEEMGCCKVTLEVLEGNEVARSAYQKHGFASYELDPKAGKALFLEKKITP